MTAWLRVGRFGMLAVIVVAVLGAAHGWQRASEPVEPTSSASETAKGRKPPRQVLLLRHAEKPLDADDVHLTSRGAARAAALPSLFAIAPTFPTKPAPFARPDFLFAAKHSKHSNRSIETLTPLAKALDIPIDHKHADKHYLAVIEHVFDDAKYSGKTVLIGWHHGNVPEMAVAIAARAKNADKLKGQIPDRWEGAVYDRIWVITFDDAGNAAFANLPQKLMFGDSKK